MTGIYNDEFLEYLEENLGSPVKTNPKNIICNCPWCDVGKITSKPHMWLSLESPIFHCFRGGCQESGVINKLLQKIEGVDNSDKFIDKSKVSQFAKNKLEFGRNVIRYKKLLLPDLAESVFPAKTFYIRQRLKFSDINVRSIKGLIFDVDKFIEINNIKLDEKVSKFIHYLHTNFIGFLSDNNSCVIFRNIDSKAEFRYYKFKIKEPLFLDYYSLPGGNFYSNDIVIGEGIFDIYTEHIYDVLGLKNSSKLYAAALSTSYQSLIKSIVFDHQIFRPNVHILSDSGMKIEYYNKLQFFNKHLINSLNVYYNRSGGDFNDTPIIVDRHVVT